MVRFTDDLRLIIKLISCIILIGFVMTVMLVAAFMIGWEMALGMGFVFVLGFFRNAKSRT